MNQSKNLSKNSFVSIITPVYNREFFVLECIRSVQEQTFQNYEHIIVDDMSSDKTAQNVRHESEKDERIHLITLKKNSGGRIGKVRNRGIKEAKGEYIAFIDSDDFWEKNKIETQIDFMRKNDLDFSYHPLQKFRESHGDQISFWGKRCPRQDIFEGLFLKNFIATSSVAVKREVLKKYGGFDGSLFYAEDYALWLSLALEGFSIGFLENVLGGFRRNLHGNINSLLKKREKLASSILIRKKILSEKRCKVISRLERHDILYGYIFLYFELIKEVADENEKKKIFSELMEEIFSLNLSSFLSKEIVLLKNLRQL